LGGVKVFHAGTRFVDHQLVTSGGRVLGVTAVAEDLAAAVQRAYAGVGKIRFEGMHYRRDIGAKEIERLPRGAKGARGSKANPSSPAR
jgi:phosphoribosylamine--glycine ligase